MLPQIVRIDTIYNSRSASFESTYFVIERIYCDLSPSELLMIPENSIRSGGWLYIV